MGESWRTSPRQGAAFGVALALATTIPATVDLLPAGPERTLVVCVLVAAVVRLCLGVQLHADREPMPRPPRSPDLDDTVDERPGSRRP